MKNYFNIVISNIEPIIKQIKFVFANIFFEEDEQGTRIPPKTIISTVEKVEDNSTSYEDDIEEYEDNKKDNMIYGANTIVDNTTQEDEIIDDEKIKEEVSRPKLDDLDLPDLEDLKLPDFDGPDGSDTKSKEKKLPELPDFGEFEKFLEKNKDDINLDDMSIEDIDKKIKELEEKIKKESSNK